jgi:hypothetical protein
MIILTHSRGFSFLTFLCALSSGSGDFTRIYSQRGTVRAPLPFLHARVTKFGEGLGLLCALFTSLSLYTFHLSLSLLLSLPLSLLSLPLYIFPSTFLSLFPSLSLLFIILFGVSNGRFRPCFFLNTSYVMTVVRFSRFF